MLTQNRSKGAGWILLLLLIAQPILLIVGYQAIDRIQAVRSITELQLAALPDVRLITERMALLGEYRGSCTAASLLKGSQQKLDSLCDERYRELIPIYPNLPVLQDGQTPQFFEAVTRLNAEKLTELNSLYLSSKAILDPEALTYQLGFEVYRFYPQLVEHLGYARGSLSKVNFRLQDAKVLDYTRGAIAQLGNTFINTMLLGSSADQSRYAVLVDEALEYVDRVSEFSLVGLEAQVIENLFIEGTELIRGLAARADRETLELDEALNERLEEATNDLQLTIALLFSLQLLLLMSAKRSLQTVKALNKSVQAEHDARERLESTLDKQKEMFAIIGHELRTPVATIKMLTAESSWKDVEKLNQINEISDNLLHVLEDLRVVISPERALAATKSEKDSPVRVVTRALSSLEGLVREKGLSLRVYMPEQSARLFSFHVQPLRQTVTNLVKNAALHSEGTQILVSLEINYGTDDGALATLRVEDDGKGIPEHSRASVFEAFGRGDTKADGSGLGLFIVKSLAEVMDGTLAYSQSSMGGAGFELSFPMTRAKSEQLDDEDKHTQSMSLNGLRVLFAEDDGMLRMLTDKLLTKDGAHVSSFENGRLAFEAFRPENYDLVITDLMMPEMNGHELTKLIRSQSDEVIIIAVTAAVLGAETEQFIHEGADFVLPKPITKKGLINALSEIEKARNLKT